MSDQPFGQMNLPAPILAQLQKGIMSYRYRGREMWKCPFDLAIYAELLWDLRPRTVIEFGSNRGGSALWLADQLQLIHPDGFQLFSLDIAPVQDLPDPRIRFAYCDVAQIEAHFDLADLRGLPRPLLLIDDASHQAAHVLGLLRYFDQVLRPGDYVIVEDGVLSAFGWDAEYQGGPLAALQCFLAETGGRYHIDRPRCDRFGPNMTWNPEGYLKRL